MFGIKITLNEHQFIEEFKKVRPYSFSYKGLSIIFNYLMDYTDCIQRNVEFDPISFCCEFEEMSINEFCINVLNLKGINNEDYNSFEEFIEAVEDSGIIVAGYCVDADTVITESYSW